VLDVACGSGRHMRWFAQLGHPVTGVDRDAHALAAARAWGEVVEADIESGPGPARPPLRRRGRHPLPVAPAAAHPRGQRRAGGVLLYETFAAGNETVGKPSRPDFLLQPGELLQACQGLRIVAYEDGFLDAPARFVQRIAAVREPGRAPAASRRRAIRWPPPEAAGRPRMLVSSDQTPPDP
jgi:SAM-dependent methyltransferase